MNQGQEEGQDMAKLQYRTLSNRMVGKLEAEKETLFWDRELTGFGVRVYPSGTKVYVAQARGPKGPRRVTVGRYGVVHAEQARQRAARIITRIKAGDEAMLKPQNPAGGPTVAELAGKYLDEYAAVRCKPKTRETARTAVHRHILPALGRLPLTAVERAQVSEMHQRLCGTPSAANMALRTLSLMYRLAGEWGLVPEGTNPCRSVARYSERRRERFLTDKEFTRLGQTLEEVGTRGGATAPAVAAIRLLMLTGCRKNEILKLRWEDVALEESELRLPDTKTGARVVPLSPQAVKIFEELPRTEGNPWVIHGKRLGTHITELNDAWQTVRARAGLSDVRLHDLRHSFASRALGESLPAIGKLLGHARVETTARYAHPARDSVREAALMVSESIAADVLKGYPGASSP